MPTVTFVISDTPDGVSVHSDFQPAIGNPCSPAQAAALDIISRTRKEYGLELTKADKSTLHLNGNANGLDIDARFQNVVVR